MVLKRDHPLHGAHTTCHQSRGVRRSRLIPLSCAAVLHWLMRNRVCSCLAPKLRDDFDISYNVVVQCFQISPRYPVFSMLRAADDVNLVPLQEVASYHEAQHVTNETRAFVLCIPVAGNRGCVRFSEYRIEKRLWRQSRREPAKSGRTNQVEFTLSNRTVKRRNFFWHRLQNSALNEKNYALQALIMTSTGAILCALCDIQERLRSGERLLAHRHSCREGAYPARAGSLGLH